MDQCIGENRLRGGSQDVVVLCLNDKIIEAFKVDSWQMVRDCRSKKLGKTAAFTEIV